MATGYFIRLGDKTTCGGTVQEADSRVMMFGIAHAREGDRVTCGKDGKVYQIVGGVSYITSHGRRVAGTLDSVSSCTCRARLLHSISNSTYQSNTHSPPGSDGSSARAPVQPSVSDSPAAVHSSLSTSQVIVRPTASCVFAKSCVSVPVGSTDAGDAPEPVANFGATALLASTGAAGTLGRLSGTLASNLGTWAIRSLAEVAVGASSSLSVILLAFWPRSIGDATLYSPEQMAAMRSASTRVRFQFRRNAAGLMEVHGMHTSSDSGKDRVPVVQARWNASKSAMVAVLDGITITWTPNNGPIVNVPTGYPGVEDTLENLLVHPIPGDREAQISHYPGQGVADLTWQDVIVTFPADAGIPPLYLVFSRPFYHPAPLTLPAFPDAERAPMKTYVQGGGKMRRRWKDYSGRIYEWDYQHGTVELYSKQGIHLGEFNPISGEQIKPAAPGRKVEK